MQEKFLKYADLLLIPQFTKPIFPGGERGIGVELVVDFYVLVDKHVILYNVCKHPIPMTMRQSPSKYWGFLDIRIFCLIVFFKLINTKALEQ